MGNIITIVLLYTKNHFDAGETGITFKSRFWENVEDKQLCVHEVKLHRTSSSVSHSRKVLNKHVYFRRPKKRKEGKLEKRPAYTVLSSHYGKPQNVLQTQISIN